MLHSIYPVYCFLGIKYINILHLNVAKTRKNMPWSSIKKVVDSKSGECELEGWITEGLIKRK